MLPHSKRLGKLKITQSSDIRMPMSQRRMILGSPGFATERERDKEKDKFRLSLTQSPVKINCSICQKGVGDAVVILPCRCDDNLSHQECLMEHFLKQPSLDSLYCNICGALYTLRVSKKVEFKLMMWQKIVYLILVLMLLTEIVLAVLLEEQIRLFIIMLILIILQLAIISRMTYIYLIRATQIFWRIVNFKISKDYESNLDDIKLLLTAIKHNQAFVMQDHVTRTEC